MKTWMAPEIEELNVLETKCGGEGGLYDGFDKKPGGDWGCDIPTEPDRGGSGGCGGGGFRPW